MNVLSIFPFLLGMGDMYWNQNKLITRQSIILQQDIHCLYRERTRLSDKPRLLTCGTCIRIGTFMIDYHGVVM